MESISLSVPAFRMGSCTPLARAADCISLMLRSVSGWFGLTSRAITPAWGTNSDTSSSRLGIQLVVNAADTCQIAARPRETGDRPSLIGSLTLKTIGIVMLRISQPAPEGCRSL